MPEPATDRSATGNAAIVSREVNPYTNRRGDFGDAISVTRDLRKELESRGLPGFKRGGRVYRTGIYKLHRGEHVVPARKSRRSRRR